MVMLGNLLAVMGLYIPYMFLPGVDLDNKTLKCVDHTTKRVV